MRIKLLIAGLLLSLAVSAQEQPCMRFKIHGDTLFSVLCDGSDSVQLNRFGGVLLATARFGKNFCNVGFADETIK